MDAGHVQNGAAPICTPSARSPTLASLAQAGDQLGTQHTARHGVKRGVDGLVADLERRVVQLHSAQYTRDLLRRMPIAQQSCAAAPQWASLGQTRWVSCRSRQPSGALLRKRCAIATGQRWTAALPGTRCRVGPAVAFQLTTDRTRRPLQAARNYPQRAALLKAQLDQRAFFTAQVFIVRSHGNTLSPDKCCTSYLRPPLKTNRVLPENNREGKMDSSRYTHTGSETGRQPALGFNGMVSTPNAWATVAGLDILRSGGNAVDAMLAVSAALMVATPHQCSPGGDAFWLIKEPGKNTRSLNASGRSPASSNVERFIAEGLERVPPRSAFAVTVPGVVSGWIEAHKNFATMDLEKLFAPAILMAENGIPVTPYSWRQLTAANEVLVSRSEVSRIYRPGNRSLRVGDRLVQPELGASLKLLANDPHSLYRGVLAEKIAAAVQSEGGWLTTQDLECHSAEWLEPISAPYQNWVVQEPPPHSQGVIALIGLSIYAQAVKALKPKNQQQRQHILIEAAKLAMSVRERELGDPSSMRKKVEELLAEEYIEQLARKINLDKAIDEWTELAPISGGARSKGHGDTTHSAIVDSNGLAVSMIQSVYFDFGCGIIVPGTGISLQNRGYGFRLGKNLVNSFAPRKWPLHTLTAALATENNETAFVFGCMGGDAQAQLHMQMVTAILDEEFDPATLAARPRWFAQPARNGFNLLVESRLRTCSNLARLGHNPAAVSAYDEIMGHLQMILVDRQRGMLLGTADPRSDGLALGY